MNINHLFCFFLCCLSGCSSIPDVELTKSSFDELKTIKIETNPNDNLKLTTINNVNVEWTGVSYSKSSGHGEGLNEFTLNYMDKNDISLSEIVKLQFISKVKDAQLNVNFDEQSGTKLMITLNIVVFGMIHDFSDKVNSRFNITAQLFDDMDNLIWSYTAIPISPIAPGYSTTIDDLFSSKESVLKFFYHASEPLVQKLVDDLTKNLL